MAKVTRESNNGRGTKVKMRNLSSLRRAGKTDNHAGESSKPDSADAETLGDQRNGSHQRSARQSVGSFQREELFAQPTKVICPTRFCFPANQTFALSREV